MNVKLTTNTAGGKVYWQAWWRDHLGTKHRRSLGPKDHMGKREALAVCQQIAREEAVVGKHERHKAPKMSDWANQYFRVREHELSPGTMFIQSKAVDYFIEHLGDIRLDRFDRAAAESLVAWLAKREGRIGEKFSPATVASYIRAIKTILGRAQQRWSQVQIPFKGLATSSVAADWSPVSHEQLAKIIEACPDDDWRRLFALCRYAGLRLGEALRLEWKDINWQDRTLTVRVPERRETTKHRQRTVPISPRLYPLLEAGLLTEHNGADDRVALVNTNNIDKIARAIVARAGVPEYRKPFHSLRKSLESEWLAEHPVMTVTKWLGHSPTVAAKHYHQPSVEEIKAVTSGNDSSEVAALRAQIEELTSKLAQTGHKSSRNASVYGSRACNNL